MCACVLSTFLLLVCVFTAHYSYAAENVSKIIKYEADEKSPVDDESLIECVVDLTQITIDFSPTILILEAEKDDKDDIFFNKLIEIFAKRNVPVTIQDKDNNEVNQTLDVYDGNVIVIIHFENCEELLEFKINHIDRKIKYLIIIAEATGDHISKLKYFNEKFIGRDITLIMRDLKADKYNVLTFLPIMDEKQCILVNSIEPKLINVCMSGSLQTNIVFPKESRTNFKNCPLRVGMATMYPFSKIGNEDELGNYDLIHNIEGSDVEIVKIIANYFNASIVWHYLHREQQNPYTNTEYVKFIINGSVDISAGGLYRIYGDRVSYSGIYTMQAVIWIYAAHRSGRSWVNLVHKLNGIYLFDLFYILYSLSSFCFRKYNKEQFSFRDIFLYSWGALIGASSLLEPKCFKHKILDVFYLILSIFMASYMNIQLVSFLTIDSPSTSFETNDDIMNSGRIPYLNHKNKDFLQDSKYLAFSNTSKECGDFFDCGLKVLENDGLTAILDEFFYPMQAHTAVNDEARILRATHNIVTVYQEMLVSKDSFIVTGVHSVLERLFEAGICNHLYKEAIGITVVAKAVIANNVALSNSYSCVAGCAITLSQVAGIFYFWIIGCCVSATVLLLEIMWKKQTRLS